MQAHTYTHGRLSHKSFCLKDREGVWHMVHMLLVFTFHEAKVLKLLLLKSLQIYRNHFDSPWLWVGICLALVGDPPPAPCPSSLKVEPSLWACLGPGLLCPDSPDPGGTAGPTAPLSCLVPLPCCRAPGPSLEETFCRKSRRLVTASQPRGPRSELRTETMVLAMPSSIRNVDWRKRGRQWRNQGEEWSKDSFKTEGGGGNVRKGEGGGTIGTAEQPHD